MDKIKVKHILFSYSEDSHIKPKLVSLEDANHIIAEAALRFQRQHKSEELAGLKTKFLIEWEDKSTYSGRIDISHRTHNLTEHVLRHLEFIGEDHLKESYEL